MNKENKTQIIWKNLKGFEDKYKISSKGEIINKKDNKKINTRISKDGYIRVTLYYKNKSYKEAAIKTKTNKTSIGKCCNKKRNKANGFEWSFESPLMQ